MRLQFSSTTDCLYGRDKELEQLRVIYERVRIKDCKNPGPHLVLLEGASGNGKTALVHHFGVNLRSTSKQDRRNCRSYIKGKFDEQNQKPYAALLEAFDDLLTDIVKRQGSADGGEEDRIHAIQQALEGDEGELLVEMMPQLRKLRDNVSKEKSVQIGNRSEAFKDLNRAVSSNGMLHQFRFRFQAFVRALCNRQSAPIVLVLDDCQWADDPSLELLRALMSDSESTNLMIIASCRKIDTTKNTQQHFRSCLQELEISLKEQCRYHELTIDDLEMHDLNAFVAKTLELAPEKTVSLSEVILRKTNGNVFYTKEFLKSLQTKNLIEYDMKYYQWTWDVEKIISNTNVSENVVDLIAIRIQELPDSAVSILKIASCLWFSFDVEVLEFVVQHARRQLKYSAYDDDVNTTTSNIIDSLFDVDRPTSSLERPIDTMVQSEVMRSLLLADEEGLLDRMGSSSFKFAHDKIRETTYSLVHEGKERDHLHCVIGGILWSMFHSNKSQQWMLFSSVDQLNKVSSLICVAQTRLRLTQVNLEAADRATSLSAFLPAIKYLKAGLSLLGPNCWKDQYNLCLRIYSKLAALESSVGNTETASEIIEETISNACTPEDKLPVLTTLVESLGVQGKLQESLDLAFEVLTGLNEQFPIKRNERMFEKAVQEDKSVTKHLLSTHSDATLLSLPLLNNEKKQYALKILSLMVDPAFHTGQMSQLFLIINRMIRISIHFGLGRSSGVAFALYGFGLSSPDGNREENFRYGKLALMMQEKVGASEYDCRVLTFVYVLLNHWREPLQKSLAPLLSAHGKGMEKGDLDYAFQAAGAYLTLYWYSGRDLQFGVAEARRFMAQMKDYKQDKAITIYIPLFQCMLNMTGKSDDALLLKGEAISDVEFEEKKFANTTLMSYQMQLAYYFGDMELAEKLSMKLRKVSKSFNAHYLFVARLFFFGMISLQIAFDSSGRKRRKQISIAKNVIKDMEQWTKHGGLNCLHKLLILKAELHAFEFCHGGSIVLRKAAQSFGSVRNDFDTAIAISARTGFRNDAALACERACAFMQRCSSEGSFLIGRYHTQAIQFYSEWGATAKVGQLQADTTIDVSSAFDLLKADETEADDLGVSQATLVDHARVSMSHSQSSIPRVATTFFSEVAKRNTENPPDDTVDESHTEDATIAMSLSKGSRWLSKRK